MVNFDCRHFLHVMLVSILPLIMGCQSLQKYTSEATPKVKLGSVEIVDPGFETITLDVEVLVENPNPLSLDLAGYDYRLKINSADFLKGNENERIKLKANGKSSFHVPLIINYPELYRIYTSLEKSDDVEYSVDVGITVDIPVIGKQRFTANKKGRVPMVRLPSLVVKRVRVKNIGLTGADIVADIEIQNPNAFALQLEKIKYNFSVNQRKWASINLLKSKTISKKGKSILSIPMSVSFTEIGQSAFQLVSGGGEIAYYLDGTLTLGIPEWNIRAAPIVFEKKGTVWLGR